MNALLLPKQARPTESKIKLLQEQMKLTEEQVEQVIATDPSPNQTDFITWIAKCVSKGLIRLPEDSERIKHQLETFLKLKRSPGFRGNKDINGYTPETLFTTLDEQSGAVSKKQQERDVVQAGAEVLARSGDITVYKVTDPKALVSLSGGTNWCTAQAGTAKHYLGQGPSFVIFENGSAYAQLHPASNQLMDRTDVPLVDHISRSGYDSRSKADKLSFIFDETAREGVELAAAKDGEVRTWYAANSTPPGEVVKILERVGSIENTLRIALLTGTPAPQLDSRILSRTPKELGPMSKLLSQYGGRFYRGQRWLPLEHVLLEGSTSTGLITYANRNVKGRWPEAEAKLLGKSTIGLSGGLYALEYAASVIKGRWPELEARLAKLKPSAKNADLAFEYAEKILRGRWPENSKQEQIIVVSPRTAFRYAKEVVQGPWPLFESSMFRMTDDAGGNSPAWNVEQYCEEVVKKRLPEAERFLLGGKVLRDVAATNYAKSVIAGRWPELESKMLAEYLIELRGTHQFGFELAENRPENRHTQGFMLPTLPMPVAGYVKDVVGGRWPELETLLLDTYKLDGIHFATWPVLQHVVENYLKVIGEMGASWPEGEAKLRSRDQTYEQYILKEMTDDDTIYKLDELVRYLRFLASVGASWPEGAHALGAYLQAHKAEVEDYFAPSTIADMRRLGETAAPTSEAFLPKSSSLGGRQGKAALLRKASLRVLVIVHPGSACGSADFNYGSRSIAGAERDGLALEFNGWDGGVLVIDGDLSDELPAYPHLNQALLGVLARARGKGLVAERRYGSDPDQMRVMRKAVKDHGWKSGEVAFVCTGAWAYDENDGCVSSVHQVLKKLGFQTRISDSALTGEDRLAKQGSKRNVAQRKRKAALGRPSADYPKLLHNEREIAEYVASISPGYVNEEQIEDLFYGCHARLTLVPMAELQPGNDDTNVRKPKREQRYRKFPPETMPPLLVEDGTVKDGHHRLRVAEYLGQTEVWCYMIEAGAPSPKVALASLESIGNTEIEIFNHAGEPTGQRVRIGDASYGALLNTWTALRRKRTPEARRLVALLSQWGDELQRIEREKRAAHEANLPKQADVRATVRQASGVTQAARFRRGVARHGQPRPH